MLPGVSEDKGEGFVCLGDRQGKVLTAGHTSLWDLSRGGVTLFGSISEAVALEA